MAEKRLLSPEEAENLNLENIETLNESDSRDMLNEMGFGTMGSRGGFMGSMNITTSPKTIKSSDLGNLDAAGVSYEEISEEEAKASGFDVKGAMDTIGLKGAEKGRERSEFVAEAFPEGELTESQVEESFYRSQAEIFEDPQRGKLTKTFSGLTAGEQYVARHSANILENLNMMTKEDARELLSQSEVHQSDIVDFYWDNPEGNWERGARFMTGLALDILLDPLTYLGIGAFTQIGKEAMVAGKLITGLEKVGKSRRAAYKMMQKVDHIITADSKIVKVGKKTGSKKVLENNMKKLAEYRDKKIGFDQMATKMRLTPAAKEQVRAMKGVKAESYLDELASGQRGLTFGYRLPFTRFAAEVDLSPVWLNQATGKTLKFLLGPLDLAAELAKKTPLGEKGFSMLANLTTKTGKYEFDDALNYWHGSKSKTAKELKDWEKNWSKVMKYKKKELGDHDFEIYMNDIVDELEWGLGMTPSSFVEKFGKAATKRIGKPDKEYIKMAEDLESWLIDPEMMKSATKKWTNDVEEQIDTLYRKAYESVEVKFTDEYLKVYESGIDPMRRGRLAKHPEAEALIKEMRDQNQEMIDVYKKLGVPMEELNPFGPGWVNNYLKHMVANEWFDYRKALGKGEDTIDDALDFAADNVGKVDTSTKGRKYRGSIREANEAALSKYGVKLFVDNPLELHSRRMKEMQQIADNYKLMEAGQKYAVVGKHRPGTGWIKYDKSDFSNMVLDTVGGKRDSWKQFVPNFYKGQYKYRVDKATGKKVRYEQNIYLPEDVYDRMLFSLNGHQNFKKFAPVLQTLDFFTRVWRNNALFGFGYLGLNLFSNMTTVLRYIGPDIIPAAVDATKVLVPWSRKRVSKLRFKDADGLAYELTPEQLFIQAMEDNVIGSSYATELSFDDFAEHVASNRQASKKIKLFGKEIPLTKQAAKTIADYAYLWRFNRGFAQFADDIPKLATYINRRQKGFSREGAMEASERLFYNYNNVSRTQDIIRKVVPFSTFPMKTAELVYEQVKSGKLGALTIPGKVQSSLEGAYVQSKDLREALDEMAPSYRKNVIDPIHGVIMAGMREVYLEAPWAETTLPMLFSPEESLHPVIQLMMIGASKHFEDDEIEGLNQDQNRRIYGKYLDMFIPMPVREALAVSEINGAIDLGGYFSDRYAEKYPNYKQKQTKSSGKRISEQAPAYHRFENANDFGVYIDKMLGKDAVYNFLFEDRMEGDSDYAKQRRGMRGNYIRSKMRQLSLGIATMTKLDSNFIVNNIAIDRQLRKAKKQLEQEIMKEGALVNAKITSEPEYLEAMAENRPLAKDILALQEKQKALKDYYEFFLKVEKEYPEIESMTPSGIKGLIFGVDEYNFNYGDRPERGADFSLEGYKSKISDEDADAEINNVMMPPEVPTEEVQYE